MSKSQEKRAARAADSETTSAVRIYVRELRAKDMEAVYSAFRRGMSSEISKKLVGRSENKAS